MTLLVIVAISIGHFLVAMLLVAFFMQPTKSQDILTSLLGDVLESLKDLESRVAKLENREDEQ